MPLNITLPYKLAGVVIARQFRRMLKMVQPKTTAGSISPSEIGDPPPNQSQPATTGNPPPRVVKTTNAAQPNPEPIIPIFLTSDEIGREVEAALKESSLDLRYLNIVRNVLSINHPEIHTVWDDALKVAQSLSHTDAELPGKLKTVLERVGHQFGDEFEDAVAFAKKHG